MTALLTPAGYAEWFGKIEGPLREWLTGPTMAFDASWRRPVELIFVEALRASVAGTLDPRIKRLGEAWAREVEGLPADRRPELSEVVKWVEKEHAGGRSTNHREEDNRNRCARDLKVAHVTRDLLADANKEFFGPRSRGRPINSRK